MCREVIVTQVRVHNFSVSLDGFGTGEGQSLEAPFGHAGTRLHEWFFATRTFRAMQGQPGGSTGVDDAFARAWGPGIGAECQGKGYGRFAVEELCQEAMRRGHHRLTVSYHAGPLGPEAFYERLGFRPTGELNEGETVAERLLAT